MNVTVGPGGGAHTAIGPDRPPRENRLPADRAEQPVLRLGRRTALFGLAGLVGVGVAGCSPGSGGTGAPTSGPTTRRTTPTSTNPTTSTPATTPTPPPLPSVVSWQPNRGDVDPDPKRVAARVVEALGTWGLGRGGLGPARGRLSRIHASPTLASQAPQLLGNDDRAVVQVIEAQTGGLLSTSASILVACEQWRATASGPAVPGGTTVDVRLSLGTSGWYVTALHPARPGPARPLSSDERAVLAHPGIDLPPASAADIRSGNVHESVLRALLQLAQHHRIGISVIRSGHPIDVFGTDRPSDHPLGRAFDTFRIDGRLVVDPATPRDLVVSYMELAKSAGSYNVGGPYLLAGIGNQFFSDATHHDHVHAGFAT